MLLGYNTNGLAHHDPFAAVQLLARIGYQSVALTLDHGPLNPLGGDFPAALEQMKECLARWGMRSVIETGARYLLDPWEKHAPTLLANDRAGRQRRIEFLKAAVDAAAALESDCVSLWSGRLPQGVGPEEGMHRLVGGLQEVLAYATSRNVVIGFEPEPGMLIDTMDRFDELRARLANPALRLTLDVGHLLCQGEVPVGDFIRRYAPLLVNVHLEDMRPGVHEHLLPGEGALDFGKVLAALQEVGYVGQVNWELSRHSHIGPQAAATAWEFLRPYWGNVS